MGGVIQMIFSLLIGISSDVYAHDLKILSPPKLLLFKILGTMMGLATCVSRCSLDHLVALMEVTSFTKPLSLVPLDLI